MRETKIKTNQIDYDFDGHGGGAESVTLLSITTAPQAPFKAGDRFYSNEETEQFEANVIYKAVVDNSWEYAEALTPELGVFYIFDGETYLYDAKIESLFKIGDSTSSNELYILNQTLPANTTTLTTEVDFSENFLINVYVNGLLQSKDLHYYVSGTNIIFTSTFEEAVNVIILYTSSSDVNINNTPTGTVNYNELINKPKINNIELDGNKTPDNLGLQNELISGTNIKTINNQSILGSGNIDIQGGTDLPDQTGQAGKFLTTNGTNLSWAEVQGGSSYVAGAGIDEEELAENNKIALKTNWVFRNNLYINENSSIPSNKITIDNDIFFEYVNYPDNIFIGFQYDGTNWKVNDNVVNLEDYGITIDSSYSLSSDDNFIVAGNYITNKNEFEVMFLEFANVFLNGLLLCENIDYTLEPTEMGIKITFIDYTLKATDRIQVL